MRAFFVLLVNLLASFLHAAGISAEQAGKAASNWVARKERPLGTGLDVRVVNVNTVMRKDGQPGFHLVSLKKGFVVTAATDTEMPIVAFSSGRPDLTERSPLRALLNLDRTINASAVRLQTTTGDRVRSSPKEAWARLLDDAPVTVQGIAAVDDIRVAPLVQSRWGQASGIYNARTPNNYPSGCVATAMAQVMRYHEFPVAPVPSVANLCWVDNVVTALTLTGGVYDWKSMPHSPSGTALAVDVIGTLLADAGIALQMAYEPGGSGAAQALAAHALPAYFGYASAKSLAVPYGSTITPTVLEKTVLVNLDAKMPVLIGLSGDMGGHTVAGDGYGYSDGLLYVHLNMGWNGLDDVWYSLPDVDASIAFHFFDEVTYNIFPEFSGEIISGRVLSGGTPLHGVTVTASNAKKQVYAAQTDANGVYAVVIPSPAATETYTVSAGNPSGISSRTVTVSKTKTQNLVFDKPSGEFLGWTDWGSSGNVYGIELEMPGKPGMRFLLQ